MDISCFLSVLAIFGHVAFVVSIVSVEPPEVSMTVPQIIAYYGYPVQIFEVKTEDGYGLTLHR